MDRQGSPLHDRVSTQNRTTSRKSPLAALKSDPELSARFELLRRLGRDVRSSEYHLTNACNIRCDGCWFFAKDFDQRTEDRGTEADWKRFAQEQAESGVTAGLLIGGEPTLYPDRVRAFVDHLTFVTISSNGLVALQREGFENVAIALTLFGGGPLDDELRAIKPSGKRFEGLFDRALANYKHDDRATFIYALDGRATDYIEDTVRKIRDNGNLVTFNYYSDYGTKSNEPGTGEFHLLEEALRIQQKYPETVICHPYYIRALITGKTEWGSFGYHSCPSISSDHPDHAERRKNGNPVLPGFNTWAADRETVNFCCTSGDCSSCRDSQAVYSWLLANPRKFMRSDAGVETWIEVAEAYWRQFKWSELHPSASPTA